MGQTSGRGKPRPQGSPRRGPHRTRGGGKPRPLGSPRHPAPRRRKQRTRGGGRPGVFLDRDGTLNVDPGFIADPDRLELYPGAAEALARLRARGLALVLVSNQSGIGRGLIGPEDLERVHARLQTLLGLRLDGIYVCPHHPTEAHGPYRVACACRKPATGLVDRAIEDLSLAREASFLVGDKRVDVECGRRAGLSTVLVLTGEGEAALEELEASGGPRPDHVASDLMQAAGWILDRTTAS